ncbi:hypothetical protein [Streptomyces roseicoloratus]|uniref:hypothetical protein n=1 Tax=Streptomyces roseicoloratus TaxID=2508722 RepID=UPI001CA5172D
MAESVQVRCPECLRTLRYAAPAFPCSCGIPIAPPVIPGADAVPVTHRNWSDEWVTVRCPACTRTSDWPHPEAGCPCGAVLRVAVSPAEPAATGPGTGAGVDAGGGADAGAGAGAGGAFGTGSAGSTDHPVPDAAVPAQRGPAAPPVTPPAPAEPSTPAAPPAAAVPPPAVAHPAAQPAEERPAGARTGERPATAGPSTAGPAPSGPAPSGPSTAGPSATSADGPARAEAGATAPVGSSPFADRHPSPPAPSAPPAPPAPAHTGTGPEAARSAFRPVTIRTARDAVAASAGYLRWLGFRDVVQPEERSASAVDLRGPGLVAQVDPSTRPTGLRAVECLWLNGLSSSAVSVYFSLAGYTPEAHERADGLGIPLFVLDLTGTPQPVNPPAGELLTSGAP